MRREFILYEAKQNKKKIKTTFCVFIYVFFPVVCLSVSLFPLFICFPRISFDLPRRCLSVCFSSICLFSSLTYRYFSPIYLASSFVYFPACLSISLPVSTRIPCQPVFFVSPLYLSPISCLVYIRSSVCLW